MPKGLPEHSEQKNKKMLKVKLKDRMGNKWIQEQRAITEVMQRITESKRTWAGQISPRTDDRWSRVILEWTPIWAEEVWEDLSQDGETTLSLGQDKMDENSRK